MISLHFSISYRGIWGETVFVQFFDKKEQLHEYEMSCFGEEFWKTTVEVKNISQFQTYRYVVKNSYGHIVNACNRIRPFPTTVKTPDCYFRDAWNPDDVNSVFKTIAFTDCLFKRKKKAAQRKTGNLILQLYVPNITPDKHIAILGNQEQLGNWDASKKVRLDESRFPLWQIKIKTDKINFPIDYKFLIVDTEKDQIVAWEEGSNKVISHVEENSTTIIAHEGFASSSYLWKTAGVAIPMFSLRSEKGFGIGEFMDMIPLVDWAKATGQHIIQTLPINDTILNHTNDDSYPYNAVSVYALHPVYLRLDKMGKLKDKKLKDYFKAKREEFNKKDFSDYQNVLDEKWKYFKAIFEQEGDKTFKKEDYKQFFESNKSWLVPYAVFSYLRDLNKTPEFKTWKKYSIYDKDEIAAFASPRRKHYKDIAFFYYLQYHLHLQLTEVKNYAHKNGIALKSDVPIGVSPMSVDVWVEPELFNTCTQAGAPPDDFSATGQNWGFPTYNWEEMAKDDYSWWKKRFRKFVEYFDAYRIDHILGFFRIWEIPESDVWGLCGNFNPALPYSVDDLQYMGIHWEEDRFLKPYIKEHVIYSIFGEYADEVMWDYLDNDGWQSFKFKPEFDTQKKIEAHFNSFGRDFTHKDITIRDGLYTLHNQVIFVEDRQQSRMFHPRIAMHSSYTFQDLPEHTRHALDKMYNEYYYHRHNHFWKEQAYKKLPALISATSMLVCGEDLGMVPDSVPEVMQRLNIASLEIQRMPKDTKVEFAMPSNAPYLSVCTTSTHDMNPIRAWWEENREVTQRFYNHALGWWGEAPAFCSAEIAETIIKQHLYSSAMLVIIPWQDFMAIDDNLKLENPHAERINVPSNPHNFWCYRMHIPLEKLLLEDEFNNKLKDIIQESGR